MKDKKNFLVIGNPIKHSLSPVFHNYWFRVNRIICEYKKLKIKRYMGCNKNNHFFKNITLMDMGQFTHS